MKLLALLLPAVLSCALLACALALNDQRKLMEEQETRIASARDSAKQCQKMMPAFLARGRQCEIDLIACRKARQ